MLSRLVPVRGIRKVTITKTSEKHKSSAFHGREH